MAIIITTKYKKIDPEKELFLGYQFEKDGNRSIDKRCDYCGKWFTFDVSECDEWGDNIQFAFNGVPEKVHCGSSHCEEYHRRVLLHQKKENEKWARLGERLFFNLKKQKIIV
jgi:hypothetical protein